MQKRGSSIRATVVGPVSYGQFNQYMADAFRLKALPSDFTRIASIRRVSESLLSQIS
ncbi:hypothetical protein COMA1_11515 [Candidatus Nitrospira nitrosa]|uniref:Uncharacterized protein n=1 Tax=Candidatus Nitrospira nitrosa TaxID=1742972 RepID=A0A0S4L8T5_9BACT|nr:hypothetical protein COMA1_11515 [Candidatus Nitrospira nitrosa]